MARTTGSVPSVERSVGGAGHLVDGDNNKPYGKCYGQVCGVSYPCTQRMPDDDPEKTGAEAEARAASKKNRADRSTCRKVRCVEADCVFDTLKAAAEFAKIPRNTFSKTLKRNGYIKAAGLTFVEE